MKALTYEQRKNFGIQIFDIMMQYFDDFFEAEKKTEAAMKENDTYNNVLFKEIIADMDQKYNKVWKSVTLNAVWNAGVVVLEVIGERGYVLETQMVKPFSHPKMRKIQFNKVLREFNKTYDAQFNLFNVGCVNFE